MCIALLTLKKTPLPAPLQYNLTHTLTHLLPQELTALALINTPSSPHET